MAGGELADRRDGHQHTAREGSSRGLTACDHEGTAPCYRMASQMAEPKCPRCEHTISPDATVHFNNGQILHLDCRRPRDLSQEERVLLFKYCFAHVVAECARCAQSFKSDELGADLLGNRTHLCPRCRADLTERVRLHLDACEVIPQEVRLKARDVRDATRRLISQLSDQPSALMREAEAAVAALRDAMWRAAGGQSFDRPTSGS
jgi:hypothetical protein